MSWPGPGLAEFHPKLIAAAVAGLTATIAIVEGPGGQSSAPGVRLPRHGVEGERTAERGPLQQHDGLSIGDLAIVGLSQGLGKGQFDGFDVLAVVGKSAAGTGAIAGAVWGGVEMQPFGD